VRGRERVRERGRKRETGRHAQDCVLAGERERERVRE
jgi:hypothetical protein